MVVSYLPWREDINVGNTLSNIFSGMEDKMEFANIYFRDDNPNTNLAKRFFQISEKSMLRNILSRKPIGKEIYLRDLKKNNSSFSNAYNNARRLRWDIFLLMQDMIGILANWKSPELDTFVQDYAPDIIFGPLGRMPVSNNLMTYLSRNYGIPLISFPWDDHYSLHKYSFSPVFWIKTFIERHAIRKCAKQSVFLYTISHLMQNEYSVYFNKECKVLQKGYKFVKGPSKAVTSQCLKMIYMGNIGSGRWKILSKMVEVINELNLSEKRIELYIYTLSPKSASMVRKLNYGYSFLMPPVENSEIMNILNSADILLHVEPVAKKDRLFFRLSFSTKLVDYFYNSKCILALGGETASIRYLRDNDAAIVESNLENIKDVLSYIITNPSIVNTYAEKSWACGLRNHNIELIQDNLYKDFYRIKNGH